MSLTKYTAWPTGQQEEIRARIAAHRAADAISQGDGHTCAIGCSLNGRYDHSEYSRVLGVPPAIAQLVDAIHEGLPRARALDWPGRVAAALVPGHDTTHAWTRFALWLLRLECPSAAGETVAALYERRLEGDEPLADEWAAAAWATWEAAGSAAGSAVRVAREAAAAARVEARAREAAAEAAPEAAARAVAWATWAAAESAAHAAELAAHAAARASRAAYVRQATRLRKILAT